MVQVVFIHQFVTDHSCFFLTVWDRSKPLFHTLNHTRKGKALDEPPTELADQAEG